MTEIRQLPQAFQEEMKALLGDEYEAYQNSLREEWKPGLRVNRGKLSAEEFSRMVPWELKPVPWTDNGFYYEAGERDRPSLHPFYYGGLYYLQEPSAMAPAAMLPVEPGDRVLDLCAAPGGKSTELGARLKGEGLLVSNDISASRAKALLKNLELAGISNACVTCETPERLAGVWPEFFDRILVDAPCSGEGMFRRDGGMIRDWMEHGPDYYGPVQRQILSQAVKLLRPGGMLLYSTCTFSRKEDEGSVAWLLEREPEMELVPLEKDRIPGAVPGVDGLSGCLRLFPHRLQGEGHFLALLRKKERAGAGVSPKPPSEALFRPEGELAAFLEESGRSFSRERMVLRQDQVYDLPEGISTGLPLHFLRTGLLLGTWKKGRFEPSQALAMTYPRNSSPKALPLPLEDERVLRYLKGETLALKEGELPAKGWRLVTCEGFPLGWAKGNGLMLKNKYYPGWRQQ